MNRLIQWQSFRTHPTGLQWTGTGQDPVAEAEPAGILDTSSRLYGGADAGGAGLVFPRLGELEISPCRARAGAGRLSTTYSAK